MENVSWKNLLILALALVFFSSFAYWYGNVKKNEDEKQLQNSEKIFLLENENISSIELKGPSETYVFECIKKEGNICSPGNHAEWQLTKPFSVSADRSNINNLVSTLSHLKQAGIIDLSKDSPKKKKTLLKDYGLDPISQTQSISIELNNKTNLTLLLGKRSVIGNNVLAIKEINQKLKTNIVYQVPAHVLSHLSHKLSHWRDKKIFSINSHEILAFEVQGSKKPFSGKLNENQWILTQGKEQWPGDLENVDSLLTALSYLKAKDFFDFKKDHPKAKQRIKQSKKVLTFKIKIKKQKTKEDITLEVFEYKPDSKIKKIYARHSGADPLFEINPDDLSRLDASLLSLRQTKFITSMERFGSKNIEFKYPDKNKITLQKEENLWKITGESKAVVQEKVNQLLSELSGKRIQKFLTEKETPKGQKNGIYVTLREEGKEKRKFLFWKVGKEIYAKDLLSTRKESFVLDSVLSKSFPWEKDYFTKPLPQENTHKEHAGGHHHAH
ncbi:MAG: hypothetical protein CL678_17950 [Bdellovibrionaceae bacterium]|nr:hypothetical protein [Pseudobdellovibrionaceae bacterium]|tara:strand:+ start:699 stop:2195 length:1497 start_codon:yes stop_codon:yes gene_type:complete